ncbi:unnamed protein product [Rotaria sp. Silwood1]|nr:unnamed protein product [Rotaria sp. Silwood1]
MGVDNLIDINPLDINNSSKFMINDTMEVLMNVLLLENQTVNISYDQYYNKCSPLFCTYDIQQRFDLIFLITSIAAMHGILSKILRSILPMLVQLIFITWKRFRPPDLSTNQSISVTQHIQCNSNGLISILGTNVEMELEETSANGQVLILPKTYNNGTCSCATSNLMNATNLGDPDQTGMPYIVDIFPLQFSSSVSNFAINDTIETIANRVFIDFWSNDTSYEQYYTACAPISCSYVKQQHLNPLYALTMFLNIFSGLSVVLKYIVPFLVRMAYKLLRHFKSSRVSSSY